MSKQELIKGPKFQDLAECLMWCAENKPIYYPNGKLSDSSHTLYAGTINHHWGTYCKAIIKPQPIVIEGNVVDNGAYESRGEIIIQTEKFHRNVLAHQKVILTIHQGEEG